MSVSLSMAPLIILLLLFGVLHSWLADTRVKEGFRQRTGKAFRFYRIAYNLFSLLMLGAMLYLIVFKQTPVYMLERGNVLLVLSWILMIAGILIMLMAFSVFDLSEFLGFSYLKEEGLKHGTLQTGGLYRYVRHPLYFGIYILLAGVFLLQPTAMNLVAVVFLYVYTYIGAKLEEKKLVQYFGEEYRQYQQRVKMLIPFLL